MSNVFLQVWCTLLAVGVLLFTSAFSQAGIIYTVTDGATPGTFSIAKATAADNSPAFAGSGANLPVDSDDVLIKIVNNSSSIISKIHVQGNGSDPFGFDGSGPFSGGPTTYIPPGGTVSLNPSANSLFTDNGDILFLAPTPFGVNGLAPGLSAFVGLEDDSNGVFNNATLTVTQATAVPEPSSAFVFTIALGGMVYSWRRRRQSNAA